MAFFPGCTYDNCGEFSADYFQLLASAAASFDHDAIRCAGDIVTQTIRSGGRIYSCGNGGSAAIANHLTCDCLKGVRTDTEIKPKVYSLSATVELLTAIANDIEYAQVFSFQLESLGQPGDLLIAISSSGNSANIINALKTARSLDMRTIAFTGFDGGEAAHHADVTLWAKAQNYGVVEDLHQSLMHILAQYLRQAHLANKSQVGKKKF